MSSVEADSAILTLIQKKLRDLHRRGSEALTQMSDEDVNWRANEESNSVANLVHHMAGNMRQRILSGIAGEPDNRDRDREFNDRSWVTRDELRAVWDEVFGRCEEVVGGMKAGDLVAAASGAAGTRLDLLFGVATHISEHVGQVLFVAKQRLGSEYDVLWSPPKKA